MNTIQEAFESNYIPPVGPMVVALERELAGKTGIPNVLAVSIGGIPGIEFMRKRHMGDQTAGLR